MSTWNRMQMHRYVERERKTHFQKTMKMSRTFEETCSCIIWGDLHQKLLWFGIDWNSWLKLCCVGNVAGIESINNMFDVIKMGVRLMVWWLTTLLPLFLLPFDLLSMPLLSARRLIRLPLQVFRWDFLVLWSLPNPLQVVFNDVLLFKNDMLSSPVLDHSKKLECRYNVVGLDS